MAVETAEDEEVGSVVEIAEDEEVVLEVGAAEEGALGEGEGITMRDRQTPCKRWEASCTQ